MEYIIYDEEHIARYCRPNDTDQGMPSPGAFNLRPIDKGQLSVNWLEFFSPLWLVINKNHRELVLKQVGDVIQMDRSSGGLFAVLNVGLAKQAIIAGGGAFSRSVVHTPT